MQYRIELITIINNMELKARIAQLLKYSEKNISEFSRFVGFKTPQAMRELLKGNTKSLSEIAQNKILSAFPELNREWLLSGEGDMLNSSAPLNEIEDVTPQEIEMINAGLKNGTFRMVPLINIDSVGGIHSNNAISPSEQYVIRMMPFTEALEGDVAILQSGNSMYPTIPAGSALLIREVKEWREYFGYGNIYVLWLKDGRRITKEVNRYVPDSKNYVLCHSYNPDVADEELPRSMIRGVWQVVKFIADFGW